MFFQYMQEKYKVMRHQYREFMFDLVRLHRQKLDMVLPLTERNKLFCEKLMFEPLFYKEEGVSKELFLLEGYSCSGEKISISIDNKILKAWDEMLTNVEEEKAKLAEIEDEHLLYLGE